jgi:hypothetical protein
MLNNYSGTFLLIYPNFSSQSGSFTLCNYILKDLKILGPSLLKYIFSIILMLDLHPLLCPSLVNHAF